MAADDNTGGGTGLADAIRGPLDAGDLEAALRAARTFHMRNPGDPSAKRGVEALELLMSQVWLGSGDDDEAIGAAAKALEGGRIAEALEGYRGLLARQPHHERAHRLAHRAQVVVAILEAQPLPPPESSQARLEVAHMQLEDSTRVAGPAVIDRLRSEAETLDAIAPSTASGGGLNFDDVTTAAPDAEVPREAFGDGGFAPESTRHLSIGDYEVVEDGEAVQGAEALEVPSAPTLDEPPPLSAQPPPLSAQPPPLSAQPPPLSAQPPPLSAQPPSSAESPAPPAEAPPSTEAPSPPRAESSGETAALAAAPPDETLDVVSSAQPAPPARRRKKKKTAPVEFKETTRVAGPGELPLDQLRREMEAEQSDQLDAFLGDMDDEDQEEATERAVRPPERSSASSPAPSRGPVVPKPPGPAVPPPPAPPAPEAAAPLRPTDEPNPQAAIEASLQLDITVVPDLIGAIEAEAAESAVPASAPPPAPAPHPAAGPPPAEPQASEAPANDLPPVLEPSYASELPPPMDDEDDDEPTTRAQVGRGPVVPPAPSGPPAVSPPIAPSPGRRDRGDATLQTKTGPDAAPMTPRVSAPPLPSAPAPHADAGPPPNDRISALPPEPAPPPVDVGDVHAPVDTSEITISQAPPRWEEPTDPGSVETSWAGVRVFDEDPPTFAAGTEGVDADRWDDMSAPGEEPVIDDEERAAAALVTDGKLRDALRAYQDLAAKRPSEQRLWDKVAHVARLLQERSK